MFAFSALNPCLRIPPRCYIKNLSRDIQKEFPGIDGFGVCDLWDMVCFCTEYPSDEILSSLVPEISWSKHIVILTKCKDIRQR